MNHGLYDSFDAGPCVFSSHRRGTANRGSSHFAISWDRLARTLILDGPYLRIPAFTVTRFSQRFINPEPIVIDTGALPLGLYRITVVHHFQVEATYPDLDDCPAAIFLARKSSHGYTVPEKRPVECRSLIHLAIVDTANRKLVPHVSPA